MRRLKLFTKLTLFITLSKLAIVALFVWLLPLLVDKVAFEYTNTYLKEQKKKVLKEIEQNGIDFYLQGDDSYGSYTLLKEEYISLEPAGITFLPDTIETSMRVVENDTLNYRVLTHVLTYNSKRYILEVGKSVAAIGQYNRPLQKMALYVLIGLIFLTIVVDLVYTRVLLRPLNVIIRTKLRNRKFPFKEELPPLRTSTSDFKYLDTSLAELMEKIREDFEKEREFTSNASHELMTPIGILQNKIENLLTDGKLDDETHVRIEGMMRTLNRLKRIVRSLLLISRIENDQFVKKDTVFVKALVEEVMEELGHRLEEKELHFSMQVQETSMLRNVNRDLIFQLVYNLVNNAIRYNKPAGSISISEGHTNEGNYFLAVADTGIGIPEKDIPFIFDRFKKAKNTGEEGFGLGLSIVQSIARYHEIDIRITAKEERGTQFMLVFPLSV